MRRSILILGILLVTLGAWAGDPSEDNGDDWNELTRAEKAMLVIGITLGENLFLQFIENEWVWGEDILEPAYDRALALQGDGDVSIGAIVDAMDRFYSLGRNRRTPIWLAYIESRGISIAPPIDETGSFPVACPSSI
jgi:hypothetical protein